MQLPFQGCSDYSVMQEFTTSKEKFLQYFENNGFTSACNSILSDFYTNNYSCKYYNVDQFNYVIKNHQPNSPKTFHLNIRSINKNCHLLHAFLSLLQCDFDIIMLTELGHADVELIEKIFKNYKLYADLPKTSKGGAGILVKTDRFDSIHDLSDSKFVPNCKCKQCMCESVFINVVTKNCTITIYSWLFV